MNEKAAIEVLGQVKEVLDKHGIKYWLDLGTALGAVRNGKLIPWDHDIDLGFFDDQISKITDASHELYDKGFAISKSHFRKKGCLICFNYYHQTGNNAMRDWIAIKNSGGKLLHCMNHILSIPNYEAVESGARSITKIFAKMSQFLPIILKKQCTRVISVLEPKIGSEIIKVVVPSHYFQNLETIPFYEMEFSAPSPVEKYLEYRYGEDWRIPKKDYIYYEEDGAIKKI